MFNARKLRGIMVEKGYTAEQMSKILGRNQSTMYRKMAGISEFTRYEIQLIASALSLTAKEIEEIFFAKELA